MPTTRRRVTRGSMPSGDRRPRGDVTVTTSPTATLSVRASALPSSTGAGPSVGRSSARSASGDVFAITSVTVRSSDGTIPLSLATAPPLPLVSSTWPCSAGAAPATPGQGTDLLDHRPVVAQGLRADAEDADVRRRAEDAGADLGLQAGHQAERDQKRHHAHRHAEDRDARDQGDEGLLAARRQVAQGDPQLPGHPAHSSVTSLPRSRPPSGRMCGNRITSRIEGEPVRIMARRSMPTPQPPVGGRPCPSARTKSSSI